MARLDTKIDQTFVYAAFPLLIEEVLDQGHTSDRSQTSVLYSLGQATLLVEGHDFEYNKSGNLKSGIIESFDYARDEPPGAYTREFLIDGLEFNVTEVMDMVLNSAPERFENLFALVPLEITGQSMQDINNVSVGRAWVPLSGGVTGHFFGGDDNFVSGSGDDRLFGGRGNDKLSGGGGDDRLFGQARHDWLQGEIGNDLLKGGKGNDVLWGGSGRDRLVGGEGSDIFIFHQHSNRDKVLDFELGVDSIYFNLSRAPEIYDILEGARMDFKGGSVLFIDIKAEELTADHFTSDFPYYDG
ncbi:MAG: hypothetical protein KDK24_18475 [Pseudooceanicola sp.]|nr:hypothetical protein [Pseudooceanicola sp.]